MGLNTADVRFSRGNFSRSEPQLIRCGKTTSPDRRTKFVALADVGLRVVSLGERMASPRLLRGIHARFTPFAVAVGRWLRVVCSVVVGLVVVSVASAASAAASGGVSLVVSGVAGAGSNPCVAAGGVLGKTATAGQFTCTFATNSASVPSYSFVVPAGVSTTSLTAAGGKGGDAVVTQTNDRAWWCGGGG